MEPKSATDTSPSVSLGLDIGTSGARALVLEGKSVLGEGSADYPLHTDAPGHAEQEPRDWWHRAVAAARQALEAAGGPRIDAIGLSGQMHGAVLLDQDLAPVRRALLWCDGRAAGDALEVTRELGRERIIEASGNLPMPGFTGPQLRWLARSESLGGVRWVVCAKDFVRIRLTGQMATDPSDASGTGLYGVDEGWSAELCDAYGVDSKLLPPVIESGDAAGTLAEQPARDLGLEPGIPVAAGAADNAAAALGSGVVRPGTLLLSIGTSGTVVAPLARPRPDLSGRCHLFRHAAPGSWYAMAVVLSAAGALAWWESVTGTPIAELSAAASEVGPGSDGVTMTPFLSGRRMPVADPDARAGFAGMALSHGMGHLTRAVVEGACFSMAEGLECVRDLGVDDLDAVVTGGAARHSIWMQALALALPGLRLHTAAPKGGAALGAALLGMSAAGADLGGRVDEVITRQSVPDQELSEADYAAVATSYDRYRELAAIAGPTTGTEERS